MLLKLHKLRIALHLHIFQKTVLEKSQLRNIVHCNLQVDPEITVVQNCRLYSIALFTSSRPFSPKISVLSWILVYVE